MIIAYMRIRKWLVWPLAYIGAFVPFMEKPTNYLISKYGFVVR